MAEATPAGERVRCPRLSRHGGDEVSASVLNPKLPPAAQTDSFPLDARRPDDRPALTRNGIKMGNADYVMAALMAT
jgi:hypothetical protein